MIVTVTGTKLTKLPNPLRKTEFEWYDNVNKFESTLQRLNLINQEPDVQLAESAVKNLLDQFEPDLRMMTGGNDDNHITKPEYYDSLLR